MMKRNDGFTLVELLCAIVAGSIVTAATTTILLLGLRMNSNASQMATQDNQAVICLSVMEDMIKENEVNLEDLKNGQHAEIKKTDESNAETTLIEYTDDKKIKTSSGAVLLEDVASCVFTEENGLIKIEIQLAENGETFVKRIRPLTGKIINIG